MSWALYLANGTLWKIVATHQETKGWEGPIKKVDDGNTTAKVVSSFGHHIKKKT